MIKIEISQSNEDSRLIMGTLETDGTGAQIRNELVGVLLSLYDSTSPELVVDAISGFTAELANRHKGEK